MTESFDIEKQLQEMHEYYLAVGFSDSLVESFIDSFAECYAKGYAEGLARCEAVQKAKIIDFVINELRKMNLDSSDIEQRKKRYGTAVNRPRLRSYNTVVAA